MFKIDVCKVCGVNCFWIEGIDGDLAEKEVCSPECLAQLQSAQQSRAVDLPTESRQPSWADDGLDDAVIGSLP